MAGLEPGLQSDSGEFCRNQFPVKEAFAVLLKPARECLQISNFIILRKGSYRKIVPVAQPTVPACTGKLSQMFLKALHRHIFKYVREIILCVVKVFAADETKKIAGYWRYSV